MTADANQPSGSSELLVVTLPGVQRFIAEAQSTSDLRAASEIVSELARTAAIACLTAGASQLVLPRPTGPTDELTAEGLPNRIVALAAPGLGPAVGRAAVRAVNERWRGWLRRSLDLVEDGDLPTTDGFPLVQWVCVPASVGDYARQWEVATRAVAARRMVRDFRPVERFGRPLCSLSPRWVAEPAPEGVPPHEVATLSAANWVKRRWRRLQGLDGFPSTASVASAPFRRAVLAAMAAPDVAEAVRSLRDAARAVSARRETAIAGMPRPDRDAARWLAESGGPWVYPQWWLVERLSAEADLEKEVLARFVKEGERAAIALGKAMATRGAAPLSAYLAVLTQDLDSMGAFLSGDAADAAGRTLTSIDPDAQGAVFSDLQALGTAQRHELESPQCLGVPVYGGGDDLLAFLPAATALGAARACHALVPDTLPTVSTTVLFFHFQGGLQPALTRAHHLLEMGKTRVEGKHALVVGYQRRSGTSAESIQPWLSPDGTETVEALKRFAANCQFPLSPRLVVQLGRDGEELASLARGRPAMYRAELARLVGRHLSGDPEQVRIEAVRLADVLVQLSRTEAAPPIGAPRQIATGPEKLAEVGVFLRQEAR